MFGKHRGWYFRGTSWVQLPKNSVVQEAFEIPEVFSIYMWFRNDDMLAEQETLFHRENANGDDLSQMKIYVDPSLKKVLVVFGESTVMQPVYSTFAVGWHRLILSLNSNGELRLQLDDETPVEETGV